jgi:hypothetical protein
MKHGLRWEIDALHLIAFWTNATACDPGCSPHQFSARPLHLGFKLAGKLSPPLTDNRSLENGPGLCVSSGSSSSLIFQLVLVDCPQIFDTNDRVAHADRGGAFVQEIASYVDNLVLQPLDASLCLPLILAEFQLMVQYALRALPGFLILAETVQSNKGLIHRARVKSCLACVDAHSQIG